MNRNSEKDQTSIEQTIGVDGIQLVQMLSIFANSNNVHPGMEKGEHSGRRQNFAANCDPCA